ncbi:MAG: ferritin family protein [Deltaproteobacteria bacterium]|jgi:rubrerythrin|nr:ferritin family protein [Deltaproteobacteria bacterium]
MFSLRDIVDIAVQIEQNGESVYRSAAKKMKDPLLRSLLQWLADEEAQHAKWFEALIDAMPVGGDFPEQAKMGRALLQNAVGVHSFVLEDADFSSMETVEELIDLVREFEDDTVLFYKMLQPLIEDQKTLEQLHAIIQEEENHARRLNEVLSESLFVDGKG